MVKFKITDYKNIEPTNPELIEVLTYYEGVLPMLLHLLLPYDNWVTYNNNLKEKGIYDKVYEEYYRIRVEFKKTKDKKQYRFNQLLKFLEENPEIDEILVNSINGLSGEIIYD